ncbi:MAG: hypothetical protein O9346_13685 [Leptospiraceae bacterium]|jgi:hypothetical protein|nr:hypothetical protein [Leptospiraceae bacterium]MCZ8347461.1 hypothetical protein [Leptospiraceae bacterium]
MKQVRITLILLCLLFFNCKSDNKQKQFEYLTILLAAFELGLFKTNFCEPPQLLLEEGKTYYITLEAGKRFWYAYTVTPQFRDSSKKIKLSITRNNSIKINNINIPCQSSSNEVENTRIPTVDLPTQLEFQISDISRYDSSGLITGQVIKSDSNSNITFKFDVF